MERRSYLTTTYTGKKVTIKEGEKILIGEKVKIIKERKIDKKRKVKRNLAEILIQNRDNFRFLKFSYKITNCSERFFC